MRNIAEGTNWNKNIKLKNFFFIDVKKLAKKTKENLLKRPEAHNKMTKT